jgi:DNA-binding MarR family transcriptional regulator
MIEKIPDMDSNFDRVLPEPYRDVALLLSAVVRFGRVLEQETRDDLRPHRIESSELAVLSALWLVKTEISPTRLGELIIQTTSGITKTLRRLEAAKLVRRIPNPQDRRAQLIAITSPGLRLAERHMRTMCERWLPRLTKRGTRELADVSRRLYALSRQAGLYEPPAKRSR